MKIVDKFQSEIQIPNVCKSNSNSNFKSEVRKFKLRLSFLVMQSIHLEKEIERKLINFMGKAEHMMKTLEGNVCKKLAEMEENMN